jgi:hypothetical protein
MDVADDVIVQCLWQHGHPLQQLVAHHPHHLLDATHIQQLHSMAGI